MGQSMHKGSLCSAVVEVLYQNTKADRGSVCRGVDEPPNCSCMLRRIFHPGGEQDLCFTANSLTFSHT